jgi:Uma2 family endonuclease
MSVQLKPTVSEQDYLRFERASQTKHEYYAGTIYAMTGAKEPHNLVAGNMHASLHSQLRRKTCRVYQSDMRVKVVATGLNTYPDVVVVCGQPQFTDTTHDTLTNPIVLIEVLSPSTERYDRGMKAQHYRTIDTLQDYILIAQDRYHVEHYSRQTNGLWLFEEATQIEAHIFISSIDCIVNLTDIYEKVDIVTDTTIIPGDIVP